MKFVEEAISRPLVSRPRPEREAALEHLAVLRYGFEQNIIDTALARAGVPADRHEHASARIRALWATIQPVAARSRPARLEEIAKVVAASLAAAADAPTAPADGAIPSGCPEAPG